MLVHDNHNFCFILISDHKKFQVGLAVDDIKEILNKAAAEKLKSKVAQKELWY